MENVYLFIKERESQNWYLFGKIPYGTFKEGKKVRFYKRTSIYPKPENISPFIECHKLIEANTEEEAWHKLS